MDVDFRSHESLEEEPWELTTEETGLFIWESDDGRVAKGEYNSEKEVWVFSYTSADGDTTELEVNQATETPGVENVRRALEDFILIDKDIQTPF